MADTMSPELEEEILRRLLDYQAVKNKERSSTPGCKAIDMLVATHTAQQTLQEVAKVFDKKEEPLELAVGLKFYRPTRIAGRKTWYKIISVSLSTLFLLFVWRWADKLFGKDK